MREVISIHIGQVSQMATLILITVKIVKESYQNQWSL